MQNVTDRPLIRVDEPLSGPIVEVTPSPPRPPRGFVQSAYHHEWLIARSRSEIWAWLNDPDTFTDGQMNPYRSEFVDDEGRGFTEGSFHSQVGPLVSLSGVLPTVVPDRYRDLQYFYGSYVVSQALFRPTRLQFWLDDGPGAQCTVMRMRLDAHVRRRGQRTWERMMNSFWVRFGRSSARLQPCRWIA